MARDFAGASGDKITGTVGTIANNLSTITVSVWATRDAASGYPIIIRKQGTNLVFGIENDNSSGGWGILWVAGWSTADGKWSIAYPDTAWHHYLITYSYSATTNDPVIYLDGVSQSITERATPNGTARVDGTSLFIGNNSGVFGWDGKIAEVGIWNRILAAGEISALSKGFSPLFFKNGLVLHTPLWGNASPEQELVGATTLTIAGTVNKATHPRIIMPYSRNNKYPSTATPPASVTKYHFGMMMGIGS